MKLVANQLLEKPNVTDENSVIIDTRIPPKVKNQLKHKIKTRNEDGEEPMENAHIGEAIPITMEELETENNVPDNESTTSNEGISTWVLVSSPINKENASVSTESSKTDNTKKPKPVVPKNKNKKPQNNKAVTKRPTTSEGADNKLKDSSNVQKNKNQSTQKPVKDVITTTTSTEATTKVEITKKPAKATAATVTKSSTKTKKKNKNKNKTSTTTEEPVYVDSALLPTEAKEQEIELEVSTPPVTTKKPKRSSTKKKNKTKKRKTTKPKPTEETSISEIKTSNKTKSSKHGKKPQAAQGAITSQLYNYFSREVMPSVGVGVLGLASIVGIASYFLYPFSTPVRRTFEVDKKDDIYKNNAEDYANDGNGQAEEDMLGTVLAGMPTHAKNKLNPYAGQTSYINRYPVKKEQDLRYRHVATKYEPNYNTRYPQQKTGIAHGAIYPKPVNYSPLYETRHAYTTEGKFNFDKLPTSYAPYAAVEPIYAAPHTAPASSSGISSYGSDASNSVVYGIKPSSESDFKPVYPFETQFYSETTNSPATYAPTSLYLGSNNDAQESHEAYAETSSASNEVDESKFVVGNVPKELAESATPAVVPEHGPRKLNRRKRSTLGKRSISSSLEEILRNEKENKDIFISNEIDDSVVIPLRKLAPITEAAPEVEVLPTPSKPEEVFTVYASPADSTKKEEEPTTIKNEIVESVSTVPVNDERKAATTESSNDAEITTKSFKVYEVFSSPDATSSPIVKEATEKAETTSARNMMTETTTELKSETTSTMPPSPSPVLEPKDPTTPKPTPVYPEVVTYPPLHETNSIFSFLKRMLEFKMKLGMSIVQNVGDSMEKFLKSFDTKATTQRFANASKNV